MTKYLGESFRMQIKSISVNNLGPLKNVTIPCDPLTVLVGQNGVGKSALLRALHLFYNTAIKVDERDFYNGETENDISIVVRFSNLTERERELFEPYIKGDELSVEKTISYAMDKFQQTYYGTRFVSPKFLSFREATGVEKRKEYNKLKDEFNFPDYTNKEDAEEILSAWELDHKEDCREARDDGQFFGFQNVGTHRLEKYTKYIFVPAVHEASAEGMEGRGSTISEIMDLVVRGSLATDPELLKIEKEAQLKYAAFIEKAKAEKLSRIGEDLTKSLNSIFPDTRVNIDWVEEEGVTIGTPSAFVKVTEEGYENTIDKCGHGLQRAFILTMFQELALIQAAQALELAPEVTNEKETKLTGSLPGLIIGIEEPELYQHPDRQRHLSMTLLQLTDRGIEGVGNIQVIYSTHSPLMVDYQRFNQLRIFRKTKVEAEKPKQTKITLASLLNVARLVETSKGLNEHSISEESLRQRLISLMTPWMNEGLFAKLVVLVEGIKDRALIYGYAIYKGVSFERDGISIIPCSGKESMTEAISIFKSLEIPQYAIWDSDFNQTTGRGSGEDANRNILRSYGCQPEDFPNKITDEFACISTDLEGEFKKEIGEADFSRILDAYCRDNQLGQGKYVMENPIHVSRLLSIFKENGRESKILETLFEKIVNKYKNL